MDESESAAVVRGVLLQADALAGALAELARAAEGSPRARLDALTKHARIEAERLAASIEGAGGERWAVALWVGQARGGFVVWGWAGGWPGDVLLRIAAALAEPGAARSVPLRPATISECLAGMRAWAVLAREEVLAQPLETVADAAARLEREGLGAAGAIQSRLYRLLGEGKIPRVTVGKTGVRLRPSDVAAAVRGGLLRKDREGLRKPAPESGEAMDSAKHRGMGECSPARRDLDP